MEGQECLGPIPSEDDVKQQNEDIGLNKLEAKVWLHHFGYGDPDDIDISFYRRHPGALRAILQEINTKIARAESAKERVSK